MAGKYRESEITVDRRSSAIPKFLPQAKQEYYRDKDQGNVGNFQVTRHLRFL
jgi:hypothetical protein